MVVECLDAFVACHAVDWTLGPDTSTEEAEIVKIPFLTKSFV